MTGKKHDKNRERGKTMIIKMSSQENDRLNTLVRLSGMKKQEYVTIRGRINANYCKKKLCYSEN